jgi:hypothetical protein
VKYVQHSEGNKTQILRPLDSQKLSWMAHFNKTYTYAFLHFQLFCSCSIEVLGEHEAIIRGGGKTVPVVFKCLSRARIRKRQAGNRFQGSLKGLQIWDLKPAVERGAWGRGSNAPHRKKKVNDIPAGDGNVANHFFTVHHHPPPSFFPVDP